MALALLVVLLIYGKQYQQNRLTALLLPLGSM
jgi:hypothetical protein